MTGDEIITSKNEFYTISDSKNRYTNEISGVTESNYQPNNVLSNDKKISKYSIGPFIYTIQEDKSEILPLYTTEIKEAGEINFVIEKDNFLTYLSELHHEIPNQGFFSLEELLEKIREFINAASSDLYQISNTTVPQYTPTNIPNEDILLWSYVTGLRKIIPLLIDPLLEEIYIIPPKGSVVVDHQKFGRMKTELTLSFNESLHLLHRVSLENTLELSQLNPSIRGDLRVKGLFQVRVTGDIPPFALDGPSINIRKLQTNPFNFKFLIESQTLDALATAFLTFLMQQGSSITIVGIPGSGKTTLQTALLQELPIHWRVLSLEQAVEANVSLPQFLRYKYYKYISDKTETVSLSKIVSQFLHRSPDYVNLGEITSAEEAIAWHHLLSAGIPVIQTLHSGSLSAIIPRITQVFKIPKELLASSIPHVFVEVKRFWNKNLKIRKVVSIAELCVRNDQLKLETICEFNTQKSDLNWLISPKESYSIQSIQKYKEINVSKEIHKLYTSFQDSVKENSSSRY